MIRTIREAYRAMHGREPDDASATRMARVMAAIGATQDRDPIAGLIVLLDTYYSVIHADAMSTHRAQATLQETLTSLKTTMEQGQAKMDAVLQRLTNVQARLDNLATRLARLEARPTGLRALFGGGQSPAQQKATAPAIQPKPKPTATTTTQPKNRQG